MFLNKTDETSANVNAMERDQAPPLKKTGLGMALRVTPIPDAEKLLYFFFDPN